MTQVSPGGSPPPGSLPVAVGARTWEVSWWRTPTARRYLFGYVLLAPAVLYVALLVGVPFVFSLYLAMSDAAVGAPVARFIGLDNFASALENAVFYTAVRNTLVFTVGAGILKGLLGTALAFLLLQPFKGRKIVRALIVIPFTLPIAVSVLGWKWMFDSQFSAIVLLAGLTSVPPEILDAAKVDGATFLQRFRKVIVPMIAPILFIGTAFDTVFTLSDLSIVYLLTNGGPDGATEILPTLAYNTGIRGGALGRGAAISLFLFPLLLPAMILLLRTLRRKQYRWRPS